mmetsp:Transcript_22057/g.43769  ORF Transcript_22057/g.43769 Transcript_22057/m.43769 type:complete len:123 (-) Transcript_22057:421-789(-)
MFCLSVCPPVVLSMSSSVHLSVFAAPPCLPLPDCFDFLYLTVCSTLHQAKPHAPTIKLFNRRGSVGEHTVEQPRSYVVALSPTMLNSVQASKTVDLSSLWWMEREQERVLLPLLKLTDRLTD